MNIYKIAYLITTGLFAALMLMSAGMYIFQNEMVREMFAVFGHPTHVIYPLAAAKILGIIAIISRLSPTLKEWAYAGFFFEIVLAFMAHYYTDGAIEAPIVGMVLLLSSYFLQKRAYI